MTDDTDTVAAAVQRALSDQGLVEALLGPGSTMTVEVEPLPAELRGRLVPGTTAISLAVGDLEARIAACRSAGLDVTVGIGGDLPFAVVSAAGLEFELVGV